jgi:hypothetical protein
MTLSQVTDVPGWLNWLILAGSWAVSILQPLALLVTIIWGGLQIYGWFEKRRKR